MDGDAGARAQCRDLHLDIALALMARTIENGTAILVREVWRQQDHARQRQRSIDQEIENDRKPAHGTRSLDP
jgi:hypothetical protein